MWDSIISKLEDIDFGEKMWGYFTSPAFFVSLFFFLVAILLLVLIKRGFALIWKKRKAASGQQRDQLKWLTGCCWKTAFLLPLPKKRQDQGQLHLHL